MSLDIWTGQSSTHKFHSRRAKALQLHHPTDPTLFSNLPQKVLMPFNKLQPPGSPPAPLGDAPKTGCGLPGFQAGFDPGSPRIGTEELLPALRQHLRRDMHPERLALLELLEHLRAEARMPRRRLLGVLDRFCRGVREGIPGKLN